MIAVSVIIPVFNAAQHLERCIRSLLEQTLDGCEFIFVNDGSADDSQSIIEKFRETDNRIILINQKNQGVSAARNTGMAMARGNYIGFVDADDTVDPVMFETLTDLAREKTADIVVSRYSLHQKGSVRVSAPVFPEGKVLDAAFIKKEIIPHFIASENLNAIWNKVFSRKLIQGNTISFPVGMALGEDGLFNMQAFNCAEKVYFTGFSGYHYFEVDGSATRDFASKEYFLPIVEAFQYDYAAYGNSDLDARKINRLKAEKFLNRTLSLIHEYTNPIHKLGYRTAFRKISAMVSHTVFRQALKENYKEIMTKKGKYEQLILWAARHKWVSLLFIATAYSRLRNK